MAGFDELKKKATEALQNEEKTDGALDKGASFLDEKTGGKYSEKIQKGREKLDGKLGDENAGNEDSGGQNSGDQSGGEPPTGQR